MKGIIRKRPSPAMLVAIVALVFAVAGTSVAGVATISVLSKKEKKQTRNIAKDEINKAAPGLSVANASTVDGTNASDLKTSSAFDEDSSSISSLGGALVTVASATITTQGPGRILATGSAELEGADASEEGACKILIDGDDSTVYHAQADDIGTDNTFVIAVNFAVTRPAGTYAASLQCYAQSGTVGKADAAINVYGLGA